MRTAALALALCLGAAGEAAAVEPAPNAPPYPAVHPAEPSRPTVPAEVRAYAPASPSPSPPPHIKADGTRPPRGRTCFNQSEARDKIAQHRLSDPVSAMTAGRAQGEALRARLCRWKADQFVYEVYVLRRDGHVVRLYMNAQNGEAVGVLDAADHK